MIMLILRNIYIYIIVIAGVTRKDGFRTSDSRNLSNGRVTRVRYVLACCTGTVNVFHYSTEKQCLSLKSIYFKRSLNSNNFIVYSRWIRSSHNTTPGIAFLFGHKSWKKKNVSNTRRGDRPRTVNGCVFPWSVDVFFFFFASNKYRGRIDTSGCTTTTSWDRALPCR